MSKVMVLGAEGWLGARLVQRLAQEGRTVLCVDLFVGTNIRELPGIEVIEADIRDAARFLPRLAECTTVFSCAGLLHPKKTSEIYVVNRDAPVALYEACIQHGVKTFVHISSINAQGENQSPTTFFDEATPPHPTTHYGVSKLEGDLKLMALAGEGKTRLIILRPGVFYGENPSRNLREFMETLKKGTLPLFAPRGFLRTYVDVDKVVEALLLSERNGSSGQAYIIGDAEPLCTLRFYQIVADELGVKPKTVAAPAAAAHLCERLAFLAGKANVHIRLFTIVGEFGRNIFGSVAKAQRELGFVPHQTSEEGLRRMVRSVQSS